MTSDDRIIPAAMELFIKFGPSKVSMDEIADAAGITKKTIYNHFSAKDEIVLIVFNSIISQMADDLEVIARNKDLDYIERIQKVVDYVVTDFLPRHSLIIEDLKQNYRLPEAQDTWKHYMPLISNILDEGLEQGYVRKDITRENMLFFYMVIVQGLVDMYGRAPDTQNQQKIVGDVVITSLGGVLTDKARRVFIKEGKNL